MARARSRCFEVRKYLLRNGFAQSFYKYEICKKRTIGGGRVEGKKHGCLQTNKKTKVVECKIIKTIVYTSIREDECLYLREVMGNRQRLRK